MAELKRWVREVRADGLEGADPTEENPDDFEDGNEELTTEDLDDQMRPSSLEMRELILGPRGLEMILNYGMLSLGMS
jgi:hypothetical protein